MKKIWTIFSLLVLVMFIGCKEDAPIQDDYNFIGTWKSQAGQWIDVTLTITESTWNVKNTTYNFGGTYKPYKEDGITFYVNDKFAGGFNVRNFDKDSGILNFTDINVTPIKGGIVVIRQ